MVTHSTDKPELGKPTLTQNPPKANHTPSEPQTAEDQAKAKAPDDKPSQGR
jgi:hypothetical protein